jgi:hypothetical protein
MTVAAVRAGVFYDSALFHVDVTVDLPAQRGRRPPAALTAWTEECCSNAPSRPAAIP